MADAQKVYIAVLAGDNRVNTSLCDLAYSIPWLNAAEEIPFLFAFHVESGVRSQELARNRIVKRFLETDGDICLMIDNDMIVQGWQTLGFIAPDDWDITAPVQFMFDPGIDEKTGTVAPQAKPCAFLYDTEAEGYRVTYPAAGVTRMPVNAVGSGCIAIRREVLEDAAMQLEPGCDPPAMFRTRVEANYTRIRGNDIDFCHRARKCGYRVVTDWQHHTGHLKTVDLHHVELYAKQQFILGYESGEKHGLQVAEGKDRTSDRAAGNPGRDVEGDEGVARFRLDRASGVQAAEASGASKGVEVG